MAKTLVAYFSCSGVTRRVAQQIASVTGGDLFEIAPEVPYTRADLDWTNKQSRSTIEMNDPACRPAIRAPSMIWAHIPRYSLAFPSGGTVSLRSSIPSSRHTISQTRLSFRFVRRAAVARGRSTSASAACARRPRAFARRVCSMALARLKSSVGSRDYRFDASPSACAGS